MLLAVITGSWLSLVIALAAVCRVASFGEPARMSETEDSATTLALEISGAPSPARLPTGSRGPQARREPPTLSRRAARRDACTTWTAVDRG
jgi:hypothetical protein